MCFYWVEDEIRRNILETLNIALRKIKDNKYEYSGKYDNIREDWSIISQNNAYEIIFDNAIKKNKKNKLLNKFQLIKNLLANYTIIKVFHLKKINKKIIYI